MPIIKNFKGDLSRELPEDIILKMVGYRDLSKAGEDVYRDTRELFQLAVDESDPVVLYQQQPVQIIDDRVVINSEVGFQSSKLVQKVKGCDGIILAVITLGADTQKKINEVLSRDIFNGYIFDVINSYLVERLSELFWQRLKKELEQEDIKVTSFISPGLRDFPLKNQEKIFNLLQPKKIGLKLTPTYLIEPTKSLTVIMGYGKEIVSARESHNCADCEMENCLLRGMHSQI